MLNRLLKPEEIAEPYYNLEVLNRGDNQFSHELTYEISLPYYEQNILTAQNNLDFDFDEYELEFPFSKWQ